MQGCEVSPEKASTAASAASTPASAAARIDAAVMPLVLCVWKWIGIATSSFSARTSAVAAAGFTSPAMSLMQRMWAPSASSSRASPT